MTRAKNDAFIGLLIEKRCLVGGGLTSGEGDKNLVGVGGILEGGIFGDGGKGAEWANFWLVVGGGLTPVKKTLHTIVFSPLFLLDL